MVQNRRRATRALVQIQADVDILPDARRPLMDDPSAPEIEFVGVPSLPPQATFSATILDIAENGMRLRSAVVPPLLARVAGSFNVEGHGNVIAIGLVMWRTKTPASAGVPGTWGVLFEAIALPARLAISRFVENHAASRP
jgi:hypothetical protein